MNHLTNHQQDKGVIDQSMALMRQHRDAEALVLLGKVEKTDPAYVEAIVHRGVLFFKFGQLDRAVENLKEAISINPDNSDAHHYLGVIALETGHSMEANKSLSRASDLSPNDPDVLANLGVVQHDLGEVEQAEQNLKRALHIEPTHTHALSALSNLYLDTNAGDQYRAYADFEQFLHRSMPPVASNALTVDAFLDILAQDIQQYPSLRQAPLHRSTVAGASTDAMVGQPGTAIETLRHMFITEAQSYAAGIKCGPHHPLATLSKSAFSTNMWGNVLGAGGHQFSHNHPEAWLSGIYYVSVPDEVGAPDNGQNGWVEFGRPRNEYHGADQLDLRLIKPKPGMMILFPSYIWHRTLPLTDDSPRISVAIDFIPQTMASNT